MKDGTSDRQNKLIEAIQSSKTINEALLKTNTPRRTYQNWRTQDCFIKEMRRREEEIYKATIKRLVTLREIALDALEKILSNPNPSSDSLILRAAQIILDQSTAYHDKAVAERERNMSSEDLSKLRTGTDYEDL